MILQIRKRNRKQKIKMTCTTFLHMIALRNNRPYFLHRTTMQMAVSVKKDGNVTSQDVTLLLSVGLVML